MTFHEALAVYLYLDRFGCTRWSVEKHNEAWEVIRREAERILKPVSADT